MAVYLFVLTTTKVRFTIIRVDLSRLDGFEWDAGNTAKVTARMPCGIAESAFLGTPLVFVDATHSAQEPRWALLNRVAPRHVFLVFTVRRRRIRILSARFMHAKEVKKYEKIIDATEA